MGEFGGRRGRGPAWRQSLAAALAAGVIGATSFAVTHAPAGAAPAALTITTVAGGPGSGAGQNVAVEPVAIDVVGGVVYVTDVNGVARALDTGTGQATVVAGSGAPPGAFTGESGPATGATLGASPSGIGSDAAGNIYIADTANCEILEIFASSNDIFRIAGSGGGLCGSGGDGGNALLATLNHPEGIAVTSDGDVYVADTENCEIREIDNSATRQISTVAGSLTGSPCQPGASGDGGAATSATLRFPQAVALDPTTSDLYIADTGRQEIRKVDGTTHIITTVAGGGTDDTSEGIAATSALLDAANGVALLPAGGFAIADGGRVRVVDGSGNVTTWAGGGNPADGVGDGPVGTDAFLSADAVASDGSGDLYVADQGGRVRRIDAGGTHAVSTVLGNGQRGSSGDGAAATGAEITFASGATFNGVASDGAGDVFIAEGQTGVVRRVDAATGVITRVAGGGTVFPPTNGSDPLTASFVSVTGVAADSAGDVFIAANNDTVFEVDHTTHLLSTVAGGRSGTGGSGDGGLATAAGFADITGLAVDGSGDLFISDPGDGRVRREDATTHDIATYAGGGTLGDGNPATSASVNNVMGLALDSSGDLYIADSCAVRRVDATSHLISTVAGSEGVCGDSGDGLPGATARFTQLYGIGIDSSGNLLVSEASDDIRGIETADSSFVVDTVAGTANTAGFSGDNGPASAALLNAPQGLAAAPNGTVFIADTGNGRVRAISQQGTGGGAPAVTGLDVASGPATGGTQVMISGIGFSGANPAVSFGSSPATSFTLVSDSTVTAVAPPGAGVVDVRVTTGGGTSPTGPADQFSYVPVVTGITPASGEQGGGTNVTVTGAGFTAASTVSFGATPALDDSVEGPGQLQATAPPGTAGVVDVTVTTEGGTSAPVAADQFTYFVGAAVSGQVTSDVGAPVAGAYVQLCPTAGGPCSVVLTGADGAYSTAPLVEGTYQGEVFPPGTALEQTFFGPVPVNGETPLSGENVVVGTVPPLPAGTSINGATSGPLFIFDGGQSYPVTTTACANATAATVQTTGTPLATQVPTTVTDPLTETPSGSGTYTGTGHSPDATIIGGGSIQITIDCPAGTPTPTPTVSGVSPAAGPAGGGTTVTITGTGFTLAEGVSFGASPATSFTVVSDTEIQAVAPSGTGTVDVTVTALGGTSTVTAADRFSYSPVITSLSQTSGPAATIVVVSGQGFTGATGVSFGGVAASNFVVIDDDTIGALVPNGHGTVDATVTGPNGTSATSAADRFTFQLPSVTGVSVINTDSRLSGPEVHITGAGFTQDATVSFGGVPATFVAPDDDTSIDAIAPAGTGTVDVTVTTSAGTSPTGPPDRLTYPSGASGAAAGAVRLQAVRLAAAGPVQPVVTSISPANGLVSGGDTVTITGIFGAGDNLTVFFGSQTVTATGVGAGSFQVVTPPAPGGNAGNAVVSVVDTTNHFGSTGGPSFRYDDVTVTLVTPNQGKGGDTIDVVGRGFDHGGFGLGIGNQNSAMFGTFPSPGVGLVMSNWSGNGMTARVGVPSGPPFGPVDVIMSNDRAHLKSRVSPSDKFTYICTGEAAGAARPVRLTASFDDGESCSPNPKPPPNPPKPPKGPITVVPGSPGGGPIIIITLPVGWIDPSGTVVDTHDDPVAGATVTLLSSASPGGPFVAVAAGSDQMSPANRANPSLTTDNGDFHWDVTAGYYELSASAPGCTAPGNPGSPAVTSPVLTIPPPATGVELTLDCTAAPPPTVTSVTAPQGPAGAAVTVAGTGFTSGAQVLFGITPASSETVTSSTSLTATVPPGAGVVDVTVGTPGGTSAATPADHFGYVAPTPTVTAVSPPGAPIGNLVSVSGTGFLSATAVEFGAAQAAFTVVNDGQLTATVPVGTGTVDVRVLSGSGASAVSAADHFSYPGPRLQSITVTPASPTVPVGAGVQFSATGTYADGSSAPITSGVTWSSSTPTVAAISATGAATAVKAGTTTITAAFGSVTGTTVLTVAAAQAPAFTSAATATFTVGTAGTFAVTATGPPTPSLTEAGALPGGVTFVDNGNGTATLGGTPAAGTGGTYPITITAANGNTPDATQSFTLTVDAAPVINSPAGLTAVVGTAGSFTVRTTGYPAPALTESGTLPSGVTFTDNGDGTATLAGPPAAGTGGTYPLTITAHNGSAPDATQAFALTVDEAPAITTPATATLIAGVGDVVTVTTTGFPTPRLTELGALPSGVTFTDNGDGTATIGATGSAASVATFTITASNGVTPAATQSFTLTVVAPKSVTVLLRANRKSTVSDEPVVLTAVTNTKLASGLAIDIVDQSSHLVVASCMTGHRCQATVVNGAGSRTYQALIATPTGSNPQASSAPLTITWAPSTVTLKASTTSTINGQPVLLSAHANENVAGTGYALDLIDTTTKTVLASCGRGSSCSTWVRNPPGAHVYEAIIGTPQGANPRATSPTVKVTWAVSTVTLTASPTSTTAGRSVKLTANANENVGPTPWFIVITDLTTNTVVGSCAVGRTCTISVSNPAGAHRYQAIIGQRNGTQVQATSPPVTVTWTPRPR